MIRSLFDEVESFAEPPEPDYKAKCKAEYISGIERCIRSRIGIFTSDDVQAAVPLPPSVHPNVLGATFLRLSKERVICTMGVCQSRRPEGGGRLLRQWQLVAPTNAAQAFLAGAESERA